MWRAASASRSVERWIVATDDRRIVDAAVGFGAEAMLTSGAHASGTDRVAEVADRLGGGFETVLNLQGDEPLVSGSSLDRVVAALRGTAGEAMATLAEPIDEIDAVFDPNVVKVVVGADGRALYFSRSPVPYHRRPGVAPATDFRRALEQRPGGLRGYLKHQGIYGYTPAALRAVTRLPPSPLETDEGLEQLRALQAGIPILVVESDFRSQGVDTPADLERVAGRIGSGPARPARPGSPTAGSPPRGGPEGRAR